MKGVVIDAVMFSVCAVMLVAFFPFGKFTGNDILSTDQGGGTQLLVSSGSPILQGNFFSQLSPIPTSSPPSSGGVSPGQGGGGAVFTPSSNVNVNVTSFSLNLINGTYSTQYIKVTNIKATAVNVDVSQSNLTGIAMVQGNSSFSLNAGETKILVIMFIAPQALGNYTGTIDIGGNIIPVTLNVQEHLLLFDSQIRILNSGYTVEKGNPFQTEIELIPRGDHVRTDVILNYTIKDSSGNVYLTQSETTFVQDETSLKRNFDVSRLPIGNYTISLILIYSNGIAPSSAQFEIVEKTQTLIGKIIYYVIIAIVIISIFIIIIMIRKRLPDQLPRQKASSY